MARPVRLRAIAVCALLAAAALVAMPSAALATPGTTLSAYVDTNSILNLTGTNTSTAGEAFSNMLVKLNNGTATGCTPSADCTAGGPFTQFDFMPVVPPGGTFTGTINTVPAPYSGTIDVKIFVNGGGEVDVNGLQVQSSAPPAITLPMPDHLIIPSKAKVDPKTGKGTLPIQGDSTDSVSDGRLQAGRRQCLITPPPVPELILHLNDSRAIYPINLNHRCLKTLDGKGTLRVVFSATLSNSAGSVPFTRKLKLVKKK